MSDWSTAISSFYTQFLLRDLTAKVVPGSLLLLALAASPPLVQANLLTRELPSAAWVLLIAFAWIIGFALQGLGTLARIISTRPANPSCSEDYHALTRQFRICEQSRPFSLMQHERFIVNKEACGNNLIGIVVASAIYAFLNWSVLSSLQSNVRITLVTLLAVICAGLYSMHRQSLANECAYLLLVLDSSDVKPTGEQEANKGLKNSPIFQDEQ